MPATQLAVNFPLVDVLPAADGTPTNGPTEFIAGTHRLSVSEGQVAIDCCVDCWATLHTQSCTYTVVHDEDRRQPTELIPLRC